jgi:hypothetical protein
MMSIVNYRNIPVALICMLFAFTACNKEALIAEKAIHVVINGYNGSSDKLEVSIDTTRYDAAASYEKYILQPGALYDFNAVYTYRPEGVQPVLRIRNPLNDSVWYSNPLPASGTKALINFICIDGKLQEVHTPEANTTTNKLGFYIRYTDSEDPLDIFLYRMNTSTGEEYRYYLAKNVRPGSWTYVDYLPVKNFDNKTALESSAIYFTKAGTIDQWAFLDDETQSKMNGESLLLPIADEKGLVQPYFIIPRGWELGYSRLFFYPDRVR